MRNRLRELQEEYSAYRRKMEPNSSHFDPESTIATRKRSRTDSNAALVSVTTPASSSSSSTVAPTAKRKRGKDQTRSSTPVAATRPKITTESRRSSGKGYSTLPPDYAPPPQLVHIYSPATSEGSSGPSLVMSPATSENSGGAEPASLGALKPSCIVRFILTGVSFQTTQLSTMTMTCPITPTTSFPLLDSAQP